MGRKWLAILAAIVGGACIGAALMYLISYRPLNRRLVDGQPLSYWLMCLDSDQPRLRETAETALPQFGKIAIAPLIDRLDSERPQTAKSASAALTTLGASAVPQLAASLHSGSAARKIAAIRLLQSLGPASTPAVGDIASVLDDRSCGEVAANYFVAVGAGPEAVQAAVRVLGGTDHRRRLDAIRVLAMAPTDPRTSESLMAALKSSDPEVRDHAYLALCDLPTVPPGAVDAMIERMAALETRAVACAALVRAGRVAAEPLSRLVDSPDESLRLEAVNTLDTILTNTGGDTGALEAFLTDGSSIVRNRVRRAMAPLIKRGLAVKSKKPDGPQQAWSETSPPSDGNTPGPTMPEVASLHLGPNIMPASQPARIDSLDLLIAIEQLDDTNQTTRAAAAAKIKAAWPANAALPDYTKVSDPAEKIRCVRLLPFATQWTKYDLMIAAANDQDPHLRGAAIGAMGRSLQSPRILEKLIDLARHDQNSRIRHAALVELAPAYKNPRVAPVLRELINDRDPWIAQTAATAFEKGTAQR